MTVGTGTSERPVIDSTLAKRLVTAQFPQWAELPLKRLDPAGSDHVIYRLGTELAVRLPCHSGPIGHIAKEFEWLPQLAPHLPLAIPVPVAKGRPGFGYPWPWSVFRWLDGEAASVDTLGDSRSVALELADFLVALQKFGQAGATAPALAELAQESLAERDRSTREAIAQVADTFDAAALTAVWEAALTAASWSREPVWFHGDFHTGNLLTVGGRLSAVIDFGGMGVGDPACDMMIAYTLMTPTSRAVFRAALDVDDATWARGRGWALTCGLNAYTSYAATSPRIAAVTSRQILAALADWDVS